MRTRLSELAARNPPTVAAQALDAASAVYLLAPSSFLGQSFAATLASRLAHPGRTVEFVDDTLTHHGYLHGLPVIPTQALRDRAHAADAVAVNLSNAPFAHGFFAQTAATAGIRHLDIIPVLDAMDLPVIYQTAGTMRQATAERLTEYFVLAERLEDTLSIQTLEACLTLRFTLDRDAMLPVLCSLEDEYFSPFPTGKDVSFTLGTEEILCDVGAHVGTTIHKFLAATRWNYAAIHAFEPDAGNFGALNRGVFTDLPNFHPRQMALSDVPSTLRFSETGTMGSRVDSAGNVSVQASTLDAEVEHATFIKMDVEGHETRVLRGGRRLIQRNRPRLAVTGYHYADDLLDIAALVQEIEPGYRLRLRHHSFYYYDTILYASV